MTVAAGYLCDGGIVLCADTQETISGYVKTSTEKITIFSGSEYTVALAGAGNNAVQIEMVIQEIRDELREQEPPSFIGFKALLHAVLDRLLPLPHYPKDVADIELLIAVRAHQEINLLCVHDNVFAEIRQFECIGSGVIAGRSLFQRYYRKSHNLIHAYIIAAYALHHAKRWVDGCGGKSDIFLIPKDSKTLTRLDSYEVEKLEVYFDDLDEALRPLLIACPFDPTDDASFRQIMDWVTKHVWAARSRFQDFEQVFRRIAREMGRDEDEAWAEANSGIDLVIKPSVPEVLSQQDSSQSTKP